MDAKTAISLVSIAISVVSLVVSGTLALRQMRTTMDGYALPVVLQTIEPFVRAEREKRNSNLWIYLEDLAYRTTRKPPAAIHEKLKLHRYAGPMHTFLPAPPESPATPRPRTEQ